MPERSSPQPVKARGRTPFLPGETIEEWNSELIIQSILGLNHTEPKFTLRSMRVSKGPTVDPFLSALIGRPTSRKFLHHIAARTFGSWTLAMKASNLEPHSSSFNKFWSKTKITSSIRLLRQNGYPLTVKSIWRDRSKKTSRILLESTGKRTTGSALHDAARRYFGSWDNALRSTGIDPERVKEKPFWTKKKIVKSIQSLHRSGIALNSGKMGGDYSIRTKRIIQRAVGKARVGNSLLGGAYNSFGSWDRALHEAGIEPADIRLRDFAWNKRSVGKVLRILHESEIPINSSSLSRDQSEETSSVIFDCTGQVTNGSHLYRVGYRNCGSWDATIKSSGLWLSEIRRSGTACDRDAKFLISVIRLFNRYDVAMNCSAMISNSNQLKFLLETHFGSVVSGISVMGAAKEVFGSWDRALWEAGFDPNAIRLKSRPNTSQMPVISSQTEDIQIDGERRKVKYFGAPPKSPEEALETHEAHSLLASAVSKCDQDDQELVDRIFDAILAIHHYRDRDQLIAFIADHLGGEIPLEKIKSVLESLAENCASVQLQ